MKRILFSMGLLGAVCAACGSDPYQGRDENTAATPPPPQTKVIRDPSYSIEAPNRVELNEGQAGRFTIRALASEGGVEVRVSGLPESASYDAASGIVTWTPSASEARDPANASLPFRLYFVTIEALTPGNSEVKNDKTIVLMAHQAPTTFTVGQVQPLQYTLSEGIPFTDAFRIYESGLASRYQVTGAGLPSGAYLEAFGSSATVRFVPDYNIVSPQDQCTIPGRTAPLSGCREIDWQLVVRNPDGKTATLPLSWFVLDRPRRLANDGAAQ